MKRITSSSNALYRNLCKLSESRRERRKQKLTLLDGVHLIDAYLRAASTPREMVIAESAADRPDITKLTQSWSGRTVTLADGLFDEITELKTRSGILATIDIPDERKETADGLWLLLEDIQDPGNLGSILRTGAAAGVSDAWLSTGCADAWSPKVLRGGMGAHFSIGIHERTDLARAALRRPAQMLALQPASPWSIYDMDLKQVLSVALGNEGAGVSPALIELATEQGTIPMSARVESLNVAAAAAVCLFERARQLNALGTQ